MDTSPFSLVFWIPTIAVFVIAFSMIAVFAILGWILLDVKDITKKARSETDDVIQDLRVIRRNLKEESAKLVHFKHALVNDISHLSRAFRNGGNKLALITDLIMRLYGRYRERANRH